MSAKTDGRSRYAKVHIRPEGEGDARPTAFQILEDNELLGRLTDKVVLITGGSNGLGVDVVRQISKTGARVFFTARDVAKGEDIKRQILEEERSDRDLAPARIEVLKMDLMSLQSVRDAAEAFQRVSNKLNVLVNNAGIAMTPYGLTKDGFEQQFGVNHLGHFYLFQLLKPLLIKSSTHAFNSRVINVASNAHTFSRPFLGDYNFEHVEEGYTPKTGYGQSKTCNIWMANELERRYGSQGLHGLSLHPGGIRTGLDRTRDPSATQWLHEALKLDHVQRAYKSVPQGAATIVLAAVGRDYEGVGGLYLEDCDVSPPLPDNAPVAAPGYKPWAYDPQGERQLWTDSLKMLGLSES